MNKVGLFFTDSMDVNQLTKFLNETNEEIANVKYVTYDNGEWLVAVNTEAVMDAEIANALIYLGNLLGEYHEGDILYDYELETHGLKDVVEEAKVLENHVYTVQIKDGEEYTIIWR